MYLDCDCSSCDEYEGQASNRAISEGRMFGKVISVHLFTIEGNKWLSRA